MSDDIWSLALKEKKKKDSERKQSLGKYSTTHFVTIKNVSVELK